MPSTARAAPGQFREHFPAKQKQKPPRCWSTSWGLRLALRRLESEVQASIHDVAVDFVFNRLIHARDVILCESIRKSRITDSAEVIIQVLETYGHILCNAVFCTCAHREPDSRGGLISRKEIWRRITGIDDGEAAACRPPPYCQTAGPVEQYVVKGVSDPTTKGAKPVLLDVCIVGGSVIGEWSLRRVIEGELSVR